MTPWHGLTRGQILELKRKKKHHKGTTGITYIPVVKEGSTKMPTSNRKEAGHPTASKRMDTSNRPG